MKTSGVTGAVLGVAAVFGLSWIAAIAYWRLGTRVPGPGEIAGVMLGMPAGLAGVIAWWRRRGPTEPVPAAPQEQFPETADAGPQQGARFVVRATAFELPTGNDAASLLADAGAGTGLGLHPQLRDPQGFGVLAAEVPDLDTTAIEAELLSLADAAPAARPELARALGLAEAVLEQLLGCCDPMPAAAGLLLPATWSDAERALARRWFEKRLAAVSPDPDRRVAVYAVASGRELFGTLRASFPDDDGGDDCPVLWLAVASNIGPGTIDRWARRGMLLSARHPQGGAPGEAAAGLVLDAGAPIGSGATVHFPDTDTSCATGESLERLLDAVVAAGDIDLVVSDLDHHAERCAHFAKATSARLPELDPARGIVHLAQACGRADAVLSLAAVALCAHAARGDGHTSLAVTQDEAHGSAIALVLPSPPSQ